MSLELERANFRLVSSRAESVWLLGRAESVRPSCLAAALCQPASQKFSSPNRVLSLAQSALATLPAPPFGSNPNAQRDPDDNKGSPCARSRQTDLLVAAAAAAALCWRPSQPDTRLMGNLVQIYRASRPTLARPPLLHRRARAVGSRQALGTRLPGTEPARPANVWPGGAKRACQRDKSTWPIDRPTKASGGDSNGGGDNNAPGQPSRRQPVVVVVVVGALFLSRHELGAQFARLG